MLILSLCYSPIRANQENISENKKVQKSFFNDFKVSVPNKLQVLGSIVVLSILTLTYLYFKKINNSVNINTGKDEDVQNKDQDKKIVPIKISRSIKQGKDQDGLQDKIKKVSEIGEEGLRGFLIQNLQVILSKLKKSIKIIDEKSLLESLKKEQCISVPLAKNLIENEKIINFQSKDGDKKLIFGHCHKKLSEKFKYVLISLNDNFDGHFLREEFNDLLNNICLQRLKINEDEDEDEDEKDKEIVIFVENNYQIVFLLKLFLYNVFKFRDIYVEINKITNEIRAGLFGRKINLVIKEHQDKGIFNFLSQFIDIDLNKI